MRSRRNALVNMQRRHFEFIANAIRTSPLGEADCSMVANHFATLLSRTNPQFNGDTFVYFATHGEYLSETMARQARQARFDRRMAREAKRQAKQAESANKTGRLSLAEIGKAERLITKLQD